MLRINRPGKFEGNLTDVPELYVREHDEHFGDVQEFGYFARIGNRYFLEDSLGFVTEITVTAFDNYRKFTTEQIKIRAAQEAV